MADLATRGGSYSDEEREAQAVNDRVKSAYKRSARLAKKAQQEAEAQAAAADTPPPSTPSTGPGPSSRARASTTRCNKRMDSIQKV